MTIALMEQIHSQHGLLAIPVAWSMATTIRVEIDFDFEFKSLKSIAIRDEFRVHSV